ncbi:MAG: hypothetical protein RL653_1236 [Pseudomonadota bacterium]|jgi:prepilin peptidase CpaA
MALLVLGAALVVAVAMDLGRGQIPDGLTVPLAAAALGLRAWAEGWGDAFSGVISGALGLAVAAACFAWPAWRGGLGWGDLKLAAGVGGVVGFPGILTTVVCVALVGAVQAVVTVLWAGEAGRTAAGFWRKANGTGRAIPYGIAIALGTAWSLWWQYPVVTKR